jgi:hypothetical protein
MKVIASVAACAFVLSGTAALAASAADKCAAAKLSTAGKYEFCRLKVEAKAVKTGTSPDYSKCDTAFTTKWSSVEAVGGMACPTSGDAVSQQAELIGNTGRTVTELSGTPRFTDKMDGTVTDSSTGLTWEKKIKLDTVIDLANLHDADDTYKWSGQCSSNTSKYCQPTAAAAAACAAAVDGDSTGCAQCTGMDGTCNAGNTVWTWLVALNSANFAGHSDWRLPKRTELAALLDYTATSFPAVDDAFSGVHCGAACTDVTAADCSCTAYNGYWSASTCAPLPTEAWFAFFGDGYIYPLGKATSSYAVRAVR